MKILMLGWEYPPMVSGGLATATEGLINGLLALGHKVTLVLPYYPCKKKVLGLTIVSPENPYIPEVNLVATRHVRSAQATSLLAQLDEEYLDGSITEFYRDLLAAPEVPKALNIKGQLSHYSYKLCQSNDLTQEEKTQIRIKLENIRRMALEGAFDIDEVVGIIRNPICFDHVQERTYALGLLAQDILQCDPNFDVIHAHDWMSFQAVAMIKQNYSLPILAHIHSTELDRSGDYNYNARILDIEKMGLNIADLIIAVSEYTKRHLIEKFYVDAHKIRVVYNANNEQHDTRKIHQTTHKDSIKKEIPVVTFVGRVTFQKGPSYFALAAQKVLEIMPNVTFKVVGTGDLLPSMQQLVWELGIDKQFEFLGFLDATGVQRVLQQSSMFVMPSVSEPFGIVALEAIAQNIPVVISKQSGVSEVLNHALKVDFWDIDLIADRILSVLKYDSIKEEMVENSMKDLNQRTWLRSAQTLAAVYSEVH